jgi:FtsZ-interacting cell division protein YlmF
MDMLGYIKKSIEKNGRSPSMSEIGHAVGLISATSVKYQLEMLEQKGFIRKTAVEHASAKEHAESSEGISSHREPDRVISIDAKEYADAARVGEELRSGNAVLLNCSEMEEGDLKRLIDFASGLAFESNGSIERVTSKVFLITPADVNNDKVLLEKISSMTLRNT